MTSRRPRAFPWHAFLFAAWVVIGAWLDAAVSPYAVIRTFVAALLITLALMAIGWGITRSLTAGGLVATAVLVAVWIRVPIDTMIGILGRMGPLIGILWVLLVLVAIVLVARRLRIRWTLARTTTGLNRVTGLLLAATLLLAVVDGRIGSLLPDLEQGAPMSALDGIDEPQSADLPDVYAIMLDGYPRADALQYAFDYDNSPFIDALRQRDFQVAARSHSDYLWTHVSMPSALNMAYMEQIPAVRPVLLGEVPRQPTVRHAIARGALFDVVHGLGYTTVTTGSGFEEVALRQADVYLDGGALNEFEISMLTRTFAADLLRPLWPDLGSASQRSRITYNLDVLPQVAARASRARLFVFDHVPAPHQPTVFGPGGTPYTNPLQSNWFADSPGERGEDPGAFQEAYRDQIPVLNDLVLDAIDGVLAASDDPPVILVFSDHGSASVVDWNETEPADADPARLLERTASFFAAYTPGRSDVFPDDISPVDIFRLLSDAYWGTDYGRATPPEGGGQIAPVDASVFDDASSQVRRSTTSLSSRNASHQPAIMAGPRAMGSSGGKIMASTP